MSLMILNPEAPWGEIHEAKDREGASVWLSMPGPCVTLNTLIKKHRCFHAQMGVQKECHEHDV